MPRASALYNEACCWLFGRRIVRQGQTTVRETVAAAKEAALVGVYDQLSGGLNAAQKHRLDELLDVPNQKTLRHPVRVSNSLSYCRVANLRRLWMHWLIVWHKSRL
jgi:hypothetical protein